MVPRLRHIRAAKFLGSFYGVRPRQCPDRGPTKPAAVGEGSDVIATTIAILLAVAIFFGLVQDVARMNTLRAGDAPRMKIITKYEAYNALYGRRTR